MSCERSFFQREDGHSEHDERHANHSEDGQRREPVGIYVGNTAVEPVRRQEAPDDLERLGQPCQADEGAPRDGGCHRDRRLPNIRFLPICRQDGDE